MNEMNDDSFVPGRRMLLVNRGLAALAWVISLAALPWAPDRVPTHWGISGEPDQFSAPFPGLFVLPLVMTLLALVLPVLPRIDPRKQNYAAFGTTYLAVQTGILAFLLVLHAVTTAAALGAAVNMNRVLVPMVGLLFAGLGNVMGKVRPNWFLGFRTPWALASPDVWTRTHRFGGRLMFGLGLVLIAGGLLFPAPAAAVMVVVAAGAMVVLTYGYSFLVWRQFGEPRG